MKQESSNSQAVGTPEKGVDTTQSLGLSVENGALTEAALRKGRHNSSVVVVGRPQFRMLGRMLNNEDACRAVAHATRRGAGGLILGGQLHQARGGCFEVVVSDPEETRPLEAAVADAYNKLKALGETDSLWLIAVEGEARMRVNAMLLKLSSTKGSA